MRLRCERQRRSPSRTETERGGAAAKNKGGRSSGETASTRGSVISLGHARPGKPRLYPYLRPADSLGSLRYLRLIFVFVLSAPLSALFSIGSDHFPGGFCAGWRTLPQPMSGRQRGQEPASARAVQPRTRVAVPSASLFSKYQVGEGK
jgi:hypothetical protein